MHRIRLGVPWNFIPPDRRSRRFGKPTNIDASETVWLTLAGGTEVVRVEWNGEHLATFETPSFEVEVTRLLLPRNEIVVVARTWEGDVALEIRPAQ